MPEMDMLFEVLFWIISVVFLLIYWTNLRSGYISKQRMVDRIGGFFGFVLFPLGFIGSRLLGDDFFNSIPVLDSVANVLDVISNWLFLVFIIAGIANPNRRKNFAIAAVFAFIYLITFSYLNNFLSVVFFVLDLTIGFSESIADGYNNAFGMKIT